MYMHLAVCREMCIRDRYNGSGTEGPAEYVLDEDEGTHWHTNWSTNDAQDVEKRWIGLELEEPAVLDAFRYYPRGGNMNGFVSEYKVQYKLNQKDEWTDIAAVPGTGRLNGK